MIDIVNYLFVYRQTFVAMDNCLKPVSTLSKDMKTYFFPLICCNCGTWFPSLGDMKFHFENCKVLHRYIEYGHCALLFDNWHYFVAHVNTKDMVSAQPVTEHFSWKNMTKWPNPLCNHNSDILHVAMQHAGLHATNLQPTVDLSLNLPLATLPSVCTATAVQPSITHASFLHKHHHHQTHLLGLTNTLISYL